MRKMITAVGAAVLLCLGSVLVPATAHADTCATASVTGTLTGSHQVGQCVDTPVPTILCVRRWAGLGTYIFVTTEVCFP